MVFEKQKSSSRSEAGQILLIVILVIIVASTIGLSLASRTITSLRSSTEEAESQKALAAAEAGIERAIQGSVPVALDVSNPSNNSRFVTSYEQAQGSSFLLNGWSATKDAAGKIVNMIPNTVPKDEGVDVWFIKHKDNGDLDYSDYSSTSPNFLNLFWGSSANGCGDAAIQAIIITGEKPLVPNTLPTNVKSYRYVYDGCADRRLANNFGSATLGSFPQDYDDDSKQDVTFSNSTPTTPFDLAKNIKNIILMRVIPIYKDTVVGIYTCNPLDKDKVNGSCTPLPSQGYIISSTGTSGQASHKIVTFKGYPQTYLPFLSYGLFVADSF